MDGARPTLVIIDEAVPTITCPVCGMTSYSPGDIEHGYCGNCHLFTSPRP
jgi:hypothetical protein